MKNILEKIYNQIPLSYQEAFNVLVEMGNGGISEIEMTAFISAFNMKEITLIMTFAGNKIYVSMK